MPRVVKSEEDIHELLELPLSELVLLASKKTLPSKLEPVIAINLAELIEKTAIVENICERFLKHSKEINISSSVPTLPTIWPIGWTELSSLNPFIESVHELAERFAGPNSKLKLVLPDPEQSFQIAKTHKLSLEKFYNTLNENADLNRIECHTQSYAFKPQKCEAASTDFLATTINAGVVAHLNLDFSILDDSLHIAAGPELDFDDNFGLLRIGAQIFEIEAEFSKYSSNYCIDVVPRPAFKKQTLESPFAIPVLKGLCLTRIIFPENISIFISPTLVGKNLYLFFKDLKICQIGQGAIDLESALALRMPLFSEISEFKNRGLHSSFIPPRLPVQKCDKSSVTKDVVK